MKKLGKSAYLAVVAAVAFVAIFGFMLIKFDTESKQNSMELSIEEQSVKNSAIQECFKSATVTTTEGNIQKVEPVFYIYILCLQDKGYTTNFK